MTRHPLTAVVLCALAFCFSSACAYANPNPNDISYRYQTAVKNAGRSALPQPREIFAKPLAFEVETELTPDVPASGVVAWSDAHKYLGGDAITVEGKVVDTYQIRDVLCRLNFKPYKQGEPAFYVAVFKDAYDKLDMKPADYFLNKTIRVTGPITAHRNQPNLEVKSLSAIEIVGSK